MVSKAELIEQATSLNGGAALTSSRNDEEIYDLNGRKMVKGQRSMPNGLKRGIYIQDGKKMVR